MPRRPAVRPKEITEAQSGSASGAVADLDPVSQRLAQLRKNWKWAAFCQFFYTFSHLFQMPDVSVTDIENDLARETTIFLPRVMARLLFVLTYDRKVSLDNWQAHLRKQHRRRDPDSNPIGPDPESEQPEPDSRYESVSIEDSAPDNGIVSPEEANGTADEGQNSTGASEPTHKPNILEDDVKEESKDWLDLPMDTKLHSLHLMTEWQFQNPTRLRSLMKNDDEEAAWRIEPIGYDSKSNAYWLIGAERLWIQRAPPKPPRSAPNGSLKRKRAEPASRAPATRQPLKRAKIAAEQQQTAGNSKGRAAKAQAKLKLDAQAKELAALNRFAASRKRGAASSPPKSARPMGTRLSSRLRGNVDDEEEWQAVPDEWLESAVNKRKGSKGKQRAAAIIEDDTESDLTELSEDSGVDDEGHNDDDDDESEDIEEDEPELKPPAELPEEPSKHTEQMDFIEWETICITLLDWEHIAERFEKGTHYTEKAIYKALTKEIVPVITEQLREIERKQRIEDAVVHRKRSSRIAGKESERAEARQAAQREAEATEKQTRAQRHEARLAKEESDRARREAAREQRRQENEAKEAAEAVSAVKSSREQNEGSKTQPPMPSKSKSARAHTSRSSSTKGTRTPQGDDWMLNCEVCHRSGVNMDDGMPMLSCGICCQWQHIPCHDMADQRAGRPKRNWDQVDFVCRNCEMRRSAQYPTMYPVLNGHNSSTHAPLQHSYPPPRDYPSMNGAYPPARHAAQPMLPVAPAHTVAAPMPMPMPMPMQLQQPFDRPAADLRSYTGWTMPSSAAYSTDRPFIPGAAQQWQGHPQTTYRYHNM